MNITSFQTAIKSHLDNLAKTDALFAKTYAKPNKSIEECCKYIISEVEKARKNSERCVAVADNEVFNLAIHYYDEDSIKVENPKSKVEVAAPAPQPEEKAEEKAETKPKKTSRKKAPKPAPAADIIEPLEIPLF